MNSKISFTFYSKLKCEDAEPYSGESLLAVADGLGGSGSAVHQVDWGKYEAPDRAFEEAAFFDFRPENGLRGDLSRWTQLITDGTPDTSALWASRIVIARWVYAMTEVEKFRLGDFHDEALREELSEFIHAGLQRVAQAFSLSSGKYENQLTLPTTLAAIRFEESEDDVTAEVIWAGDSRCYALTKYGLKLLSKDDEDASGAITNLFHAGSLAALHYKKYVLAKPCALLAVSDGTFDPFVPNDHFGLEYQILSSVSSVHSFEELQGALKARYDEIHTDDATMAFAAFGCSDFEALQEVLGERAQYIEELYADFGKYESDLNALHSGGDASYVSSRTSDKFDAIIKKLTSCRLNGASDICLKEEIQGAIDAAIQTVRKSEEEAAAQRRFDAVRKEALGFFQSPQEILKNPSASLPQSAASGREFVRLYDKISAAERALLDTKRALEENQRKYAECLQAFQTNFDGLGAALSSAKDRQEETFRSFQKELDALNRANQGLEKRGRECRFKKEDRKTACNNLERAMNAYLDLVRERIELVPYLFQDDFLRDKCHWDSVFARPVQDLERETAQQALLSLRLKKEAAVQSIVRSFSEYCAETSAIDAMYNTTRLNHFRRYCALQEPENRAFMKELEHFEQRLKSLDEEYQDVMQAEQTQPAPAAPTETPQAEAEAESPEEGSPQAGEAEAESPQAGTD